MKVKKFTGETFQGGMARPGDPPRMPSFAEAVRHGLIDRGEVARLARAPSPDAAFASAKVSVLNGVGEVRAAVLRRNGMPVVIDFLKGGTRGLGGRQAPALTAQWKRHTAVLGNSEVRRSNFIGGENIRWRARSS